jgi:hypothetical protein
MSRINNPQSCIACARHSSGMAAGKQGWLGWFCDECGPVLARKVLFMKDLDSFETAACRKVAAEIYSNHEGDLLITRDELPAFIGWVVKEFAECMRKQVEDGEAPF